MAYITIANRVSVGAETGFVLDAETGNLLGVESGLALGAQTWFASEPWILYPLNLSS